MAPTPRVSIVRTGAANLASVVAAFRRAGAVIDWADDPAAVRAAEHLVLPGVGAFAAALGRLEAAGLVQPLRERIANGGATLAICLGLQLLAEGSAESPGATGLALIAGRAERFGAGLRVPQLGWNKVQAEGDWIAPAYAYYANSYYLAAAGTGWQVAYSVYGSQRFVAAVARGSVLACQFHPELSGPWGQRLIERWLVGGARC